MMVTVCSIMVSYAQHNRVSVVRIVNAIQDFVMWIIWSKTRYTSMCHIVNSHTVISISMYVHGWKGRALAQLVRHCAPSRKVTGSIPDGVIGIFHWHNPSGLIVVLGSTQPLTNEYQDYFLGLKVGRCWQPYHLHVPTVLKSGRLNLLEPSGSV